MLGAKKVETLICAKNVFGKSPPKQKKKWEKRENPTTPFPRTTPWKKEKKERKLNPYI